MEPRGKGRVMMRVYMLSSGEGVLCWCHGVMSVFSAIIRWGSAAYGVQWNSAADVSMCSCSAGKVCCCFISLYCHSIRWFCRYEAVHCAMRLCCFHEGVSCCYEGVHRCFHGVMIRSYQLRDDGYWRCKMVGRESENHFVIIFNSFMVTMNNSRVTSND